jgi:CheY-like chemotaxis protein
MPTEANLPIGTDPDAHRPIPAELAHALRNPLAAMRAALRLLQRSPEDPATVQLARESLERQVRELTHLIELRSASAAVNAEPDMTCVARVASTEQVLPAARESRPDVAVLDLSLEDGSSLHLIRDLQSELPAVKVMMYSGSRGDAVARESLSRGACSFLVKGADVGALLFEIRRVHCGALGGLAGEA